MPFSFIYHAILRFRIYYKRMTRGVTFFCERFRLPVCPVLPSSWCTNAVLYINSYISSIFENSSLSSPTFLLLRQFIFQQINQYLRSNGNSQSIQQHNCCGISSIRWIKPAVVFLSNTNRFNINERCHEIQIRFTLYDISTIIPTP